MTCAVLGLCVGALPVSASPAPGAGHGQAPAPAHLSVVVAQSDVRASDRAAHDPARREAPRRGTPEQPELAGDDLESPEVDDIDANLRSSSADRTAAGAMASRRALRARGPVRREDLRNPRPPNR